MTENEHKALVYMMGTVSGLHSSVQKILPDPNPLQDQITDGLEQAFLGMQQALEENRT